MTTEIKFKAGQPVRFVATRTFTAGGANINFRRGQEIEFDGSMAVVDGETLSLPQLRGAVKQGWLVTVDSYDESAPAQRVSAGIQVRHPTRGGNPLAPPDMVPIVAVEPDERVVGNAVTMAQQTQDSNLAYRNRSSKVGNVEPQDGVPVRGLKTPARSKVSLTADNVKSLIDGARAPTIEPVNGATEDDMLARMSDSEREKYLASKEANRSKYIGNSTGTDDHKLVAKISKKKSSEIREGVSVDITTGGGIVTGDVTDPDAKPRTEVVEREGIKFVQTNVAKDPDQAHPRQVADRPVDKQRRMIAKAMCPDFPDNYSFDMPPKRRIGRLQADYADRLDIVRAAFAAETDEVKALIVAEFPEAFA